MASPDVLETALELDTGLDPCVQIVSRRSDCTDEVHIAVSSVLLPVLIAPGC